MDKVCGHILPKLPFARIEVHYKTVLLVKVVHNPVDARTIVRCVFIGSISGFSYLQKLTNETWYPDGRLAATIIAGLPR